MFPNVTAFVGDAVMHPLRHSRHQVLKHTRMNVTPHLQLLHHLIVSGGRCYLVDLRLQDRPEIFNWVEVRAVPWSHSLPPEAGEVLPAPPLRLLGRVRWSFALHADGLAGIGYQ